MLKFALGSLAEETFDTRLYTRVVHLLFKIVITIF
jgi:hypothetical protein